MTDKIVVLSTCASEEEADRLARMLVTRRLAACVNVLPNMRSVYRWKGAMAQYGVGHLDRLQRIETLLQQLPGLTLAGNGYRGIGVPDCVRSGSDAANKALLAVGLSEVAAPALSH